MRARECTVLALLVVTGLVAAGGAVVLLRSGAQAPRRPAVTATPGRAHQTPSSRRAAPFSVIRHAARGPALPARPARAPARLAAELDRAQRIIEDPASGRSELARAGLLQQLATGVLARDTAAARRATLVALSPAARAMMRTTLAASSALEHIVTPRRSIPRGWRIVRPASARQLLADDHGAQRATGAPWQILAAIGLVETRMGRLRGPSSASARGPMQFMPATWAVYGRGDIDNAHDAIMAAGRLLAANGAPGHLSRALYHYNPSPYYVRAVEAYARRMTRDPRAFYAFYNWQVLYRRARGLVLLPVGYPKVPPRPAG